MFECLMVEAFLIKEDKKTFCSWGDSSSNMASMSSPRVVEDLAPIVAIEI
jgi:hypothetical protein